MAKTELPRLVVAGLAGDTGKTLVTLGLIRALKNRGLRAAPFKKGPDFIDAAWLGAAAGRPGRNLDTFLMPREVILGSLARFKDDSDIAVCEGNRGLFDGLDDRGTHSTAELAKLIGAPVVLVVDATKSTRTVAAQVLGCQKMDPDCRLAGVILNRVGTGRQEHVIRKAVREATGLPVLGVIPRIDSQQLPSRHLGLVTSVEHPTSLEVFEQLARVIDDHVDVPALLDLAHDAAGLPAEPVQFSARPGRLVRMGVLQDQAFSFYYPENLEALEAAGAELVRLSPLSDTELPDLDGLYAGGGFPEVYAAALSANRPFCEALKTRIEDGLHVWAECGGLMYLSRAIIKDGQSYPMVGALPIVVEQKKRPQGHGYVAGRVDGDNPFLPLGCEFHGHEFHYSRLLEDDRSLTTVMALERGTGTGDGRDGIVFNNVVASYTHLHALGLPQWAEFMVRQAVSPSPKASEPRLRRYQVPDLRAAPTQGGRQVRGLRKAVLSAVEQGDVEELESLVADQARAVRYLVGITYGTDLDLARTAARGIALAGKHHPDLVQSVVRRLVWAMNDESGTHAVSAPAVLLAIAEEQPELLIPVVPDMMRLTTDEGLKEGLSAALKMVAQACPGQVGKQLTTELNEMLKGDCGASCSW